MIRRSLESVSVAGTGSMLRGRSDAIEMNEPLSNTITISLSNEPPFVVEYKIAKMGYVRFYLALRIKEDEKDTKPQV